MDEHHGEQQQLPGSRDCVGCHGLTFRMRGDGLCPRCAFEAESLIERIELDGLDRDLQLMTEFDAYYRQREEHRKRFRKLGATPVFTHRPFLDPVGREPVSFAPMPLPMPLPPAPSIDPFWNDLRDAS